MDNVDDRLDRLLEVIELISRALVEDRNREYNLIRVETFNREDTDPIE